MNEMINGMMDTLRLMSEENHRSREIKEILIETIDELVEIKNNNESIDEKLQSLNDVIVKYTNEIKTTNETK